jgi:predicted nucleic acid-binding Zn ribbon protein
MIKRSGPGHVKGIIDGLITKWEKGAVKKAGAVGEAWVASVDNETKEHTRPVSFKNGILMVVVEDSTWLYKLTLDKKVLLEKFNGNYTGRKKARDIRYRIGSLDG